MMVTVAYFWFIFQDLEDSKTSTKIASMRKVREKYRRTRSYFSAKDKKKKLKRTLQNLLKNCTYWTQSHWISKIVTNGPATGATCFLATRQGSGVHGWHKLDVVDINLMMDMTRCNTEASDLSHNSTVFEMFLQVLVNSLKPDRFQLSTH